jgi:hypothetical protein
MNVLPAGPEATASVIAGLQHQARELEQLTTEVNGLRMRMPAPEPSEWWDLASAAFGRAAGGTAGDLGHVVVLLRHALAETRSAITGMASRG